MPREAHRPALAVEERGRPEKIMTRFRELLLAEGIELTPEWDQVYTLFIEAAAEFPDEQGGR